MIYKHTLGALVVRAQGFRHMRKDCLATCSRAFGDDTYLGQLFLLDCSKTIEPSRSRACLLFGIPVCSHCFAPLSVLARVQNDTAQRGRVFWLGLLCAAVFWSEWPVYNPPTKKASGTIQTQQRLTLLYKYSHCLQTRQRTPFYITLLCAIQQLTAANIRTARPCRLSCRI